jgi:hypothetical protein
MHSTLIALKIPNEINDWEAFLGTVSTKLKQAKGVLRLAENVWLVNLQESVAPLGWIVSLAESKGFSYGILPFQAEPQWLPAGFDPNTIQARNAP